MMSASERLPILPDDQWYEITGNEVMLHHPFGAPDAADEYAPVPLLGKNYLQPIAKEAPAEFAADVDWQDGISTWRGSVRRYREFHPCYNQANPDDPQNQEINFNVTVLLTDPARPDGLGDLKEVQDLFSRAGIVGYTATRSVYHEVRHHGLEVVGGDDASPYIPRANEEYQGQLEAALENTPSFHFDPLPEPWEPAGSLAQDVQNVRSKVYEKIADQPDMVDPNYAFLVPDVISTNTAQWLMLGISGLKMDNMANDLYNGDLPKNVVIVAPFEQVALYHKILCVSDNEHVRPQPALPELLTPEYENGQLLNLYGNALIKGRM